MFDKPMVEVAYEVLKKEKKEIKFSKFWEKVSKELGMDEKTKDEYISRFYTDLSFDERFVLLEDNHWDLRINHKFSNIHIDMNEAYSDLDEEEKEMIEEEDELEEEEEDEEEDED